MDNREKQVHTTKEKIEKYRKQTITPYQLSAAGLRVELEFSGTDPMQQLVESYFSRKMDEQS